MLLACCHTTAPKTEKQAIVIIQDVSSSYNQQDKAQEERRHLTAYLMEHLSPATDIAHLHINEASGAMSNIDWIKFDSSSIANMVSSSNRVKTERAKKLEQANMEGVIQIQQSNMTRELLNRIYNTKYAISGQTEILGMFHLVKTIEHQGYKNIRLVFLSDMVNEGEYDMTKRAWPYPNRAYAEEEAQTEHANLMTTGMADSTTLCAVRDIEVLFPVGKSSHFQNVHLPFFYERLFRDCGYAGEVAWIEPKTGVALK